MGLKAKYDLESDIPAALKEHYAERDGAWHLVLDGSDNGGGTAEVEKLRRALDAERRGRSDALKKAYEERDGVAAKLAELEAKGAPADKGDDKMLESFKARIAKLEDALKAADDKAQRAELAIAENRFLDEVRREAQPFVREDPGVLDDFVERRIRPHFRRDEQSGTFLPFDGDAPRYSVKDPGRVMSAKEFIAEVAIKAPEAAYQLRPSRGAGAIGSSGTHTGTPQFAVKRGAPYQEYVRVKTAAEKAGQEFQVLEE